MVRGRAETETIMLRNVSIRAMLGGLVGIMGLALSLMCANYLLTAWQRYEASQRVADLSRANRAIFEVMQNFRFERGDSGSSIAAVGGPMTEIMPRLTKTREVVDQQMAIALPILEHVDVPGLPSLREQLKANYAVVKEFRPRVDDALRQPFAARDKELVQSYQPKAAPFLDDLQRMAIVLESGMRAIDPSVSDLALVRQAAWDGRTGLGDKIVIVLAALGKRQPLSPEQQAAIQVAHRRAGRAQGRLREGADRLLRRAGGAEVRRDRQVSVRRSGAGHDVGGARRRNDRTRLASRCGRRCRDEPDHGLCGRDRRGGAHDLDRLWRPVAARARFRDRRLPPHPG